MASRRFIAIFLISLLAVIAAPAHSELNIRITEGADSAIPIAVVPFGNPDNLNLPEDVGRIVRDDLLMSGDFKPLQPGQMLSLPSRADQVYYRDWRLLDQQYLVVGELRPAGNGRVQLRFEVLDVNRQQRILGQQSTVGRDSLRALGHYVADKVYEAVTGVKGAFSTRLAYVTQNQVLGEPVYRLHTSDFDGRNSRVILKSDEPILSPDWSPDGQRLAYVSFEGERPGIYIHELSSGERRKLASFRGMNSAPVWSPDGRSLLVTLSKDGSPDIYQLDLATGDARRLTDSSAIETEASWAPDGRSFAFLSDRSGGPQIYLMDLDSREVRRLTYEGRYNARPRFAPDGKSVYFIHQRDGKFHTARLNLETEDLTILTRTALDESPDIAPNGRMLIYATGEGEGSVLAVVSTSGGAQYTLPAKEGEVKEPAWSPFLN